jgi:hypothetical protein
MHPTPQPTKKIMLFMMGQATDENMVHVHGMLDK